MHTSGLLIVVLVFDLVLPLYRDHVVFADDEGSTQYRSGVVRYHAV